MQIVYGLLCAPDGCPVAIEVFDGNTADPMTLATQIEKLKRRFQLNHVVLVGDRGMITQARITEDIRSAGLDWISSLRAPAIKALVESSTLQLSLFDQRDTGSITVPEFPDERLVFCRNPDLAAERTRKQQELLAATERDLTRIQLAVARKRDPLRGTAEIALVVGKVINKHKMAKHFDLDITDATFSFARKTAEIAAEAATDGVYVICTSLPAVICDDATTARSYKSLALVERAFRCLTTVDLHVRPVYHRLADFGSGRMSSSACWPITWNGTCASAPRADAVRRHRQGGRRSHAFERGGDRAALTGRCRQADHPPDPRAIAGAQLPLAARRSRDLGAQHCHHRHHTKLSAHHTDQANSDPAQGVHPPWRPSVASNTTRQ